MIPIAFVENRTSGVVKTWLADWEKLSNRLAHCDVGEKDGRGWMPADIEPGQRTAERVKSVSLLVLDVEAKAENVEGTKKVIGPEPPVPDSMSAELGLWGWRCILHTSYNHTAEHPRYRLTFDLSRPLVPGEVKPLGLHVAALLGIGDCIDTGCLEPARLFYLPRCPADRKDLFRHADTEGVGLPVDELIAEAARINDAKKSAMATRRTGQSASVIEAFNNAHDVGVILNQHGYRPHGRRRWLWPGSTSGLPGVRLLPDAVPERVYSSHGGDPLNDGHAHDAFDLWRMLQHCADMSAAVKDAARICGMATRTASSASLSAPAKGKVQPDAGNAPTGDADGWPEPLPLPTLPSVPAFDLRLLPDKFAPWVADAAERARFAPDFAAVAAMVAFGSLVGRRLGLRLKAMDDWTEYGNVWGALIGLPSSLKTPAMRDAMSPFKRLQFAADEIDASAALIFEAELELAKIRNEAAKKAAKNALAENPGAKFDLVLEALPGAPPCRVYWTSDATVERLGEILAENPNGLLVERDELSSLLTYLEDERNAMARGFYLTGWSGKEGYRFDRIMRGKTAIPAFALSVIGGIQPGPLERYVRGSFSGERADGLLQRFQLAVWPDAPAFEYVDRWPSKTDKTAAGDLFTFADTFDPERIGQHDDFGNSPPFLRLDAGAQGLFVEWYSGYMVTRRNRETSGEDYSAVSSHFGKYPGLLGKLALILHIADEPDVCEVGERTMLKALAWLEYLEPHARRIYHAVDAPDADTARLLLARIKRGQVQSPFKAREIYRNGWHGLGDAKRAKAACRLLADFDYLRAIDVDGPIMGRPSDPVYYVNPRVTP